MLWQQGGRRGNLVNISGAAYRDDRFERHLFVVMHLIETRILVLAGYRARDGVISVWATRIRNFDVQVHTDVLHERSSAAEEDGCHHHGSHHAK